MRVAERAQPRDEVDGRVVGAHPAEHLEDEEDRRRREEQTGVVTAEAAGDDERERQVGDRGEAGAREAEQAPPPDGGQVGIARRGRGSAPTPRRNRAARSTFG